MKQCQNCGAPNEEGARVCSSCGQPFAAPMGQTMPQPMPQAPMMYQQQPPMTVGQWIGTLLLGSLLGPISLVLLFVWAFGGDTHPAKKNWARAELILMLIVIVIVVILYAILGATFASLMR